MSATDAINPTKTDARLLILLPVFNDWEAVGMLLPRIDRALQKQVPVIHDPLVAGFINDLGYEDLIADPETEIRNLLSLVELPWEDGCLEFHKTERPVRTASVFQVRQPIYGTSVRRWKNYQKHLSPLADALGPLGMS